MAPSVEFDQNLITVLQGIEAGSLDSVKFTFTAGMFGKEGNNEESGDNSPYKAMCYMAAFKRSGDILSFLFKEVIFKHPKVDDVFFPCAQSVIEQSDRPEMGKLLLDLTTEFFKTRKDADTFSARCMREFVQEAAIHENWQFANTMWAMRELFPIPTQYDEKTKTHTGKDKEFIPAYVTGAVFHDNVDIMDRAVNLPDRWQEYTDQCLPTWFRMALEGHAREVARYLLPHVKEFILSNGEYATCVVKDSLRTGSIDLHVQICTMLSEANAKKK
jgi:hypothetical protein